MKLLYATTNIHKLRGANRALAGTGIELMPPSIDLPDVPEIQSGDQTEVSVDKAIKYHALLRCQGYLLNRSVAFLVYIQSMCLMYSV